jgi:hypothetical protein
MSDVTDFKNTPSFFINNAFTDIFSCPKPVYQKRGIKVNISSSENSKEYGKS